MGFDHILFDGVAFTYEGAAAPLLAGVEPHIPRGWTGVVGANGSGKTTLLRLATGQLAPVAGRVTVAGAGIYCAQRTDAAPEGLSEFLADMDGPACRLRAQLGLRADWLQRWDSLSHSERKRAQIGAALWRQPPALAVDEPTNHLDREARARLVAALPGDLAGRTALAAGSPAAPGGGPGGPGR